MLILKIVLMMASFAGLCAGISSLFHVDRYVSPAIASCFIIVILNLFGMVGLLLPAWIVLYAAGFAGGIYTCLSKRSAASFDWVQLVLYVAFVLFLILRFGGSYFYANDDISHWGLVARYLLRYNRFPDASADFVYFQSYPLGAACFIYYVGRGTVNTEGMYLIAQYFLHGALFMPVIQYVRRKKRKSLLPFCAAVFFVLLHFSDKMVTIQVDHLLGFFGILIFALFYIYGRDDRKLASALVPCLMAVVVVKNSGLVFAIAAALGMWINARHRKNGLKASWRYILPVAVLPIAHYLLWILRIRLVYNTALETKHAVSLTAYLDKLREKGMSTTITIAGKYLKALATPSTLGVVAGAMVAMLAFLILWLAIKRGGVKEALRRMVLNGCVYLVWIVLILLMYLVSMPISEALKVASFDRYNTTGLILLMGLFLLQFEMEWNRAKAAPKRMLLLMNGISCTFFAGILMMYLLIGMGWRSVHFDLNNVLPPYRAVIRQAREDHHLEDGGTYLVCYPASGAHAMEGLVRHYTIRYEYETNNIHAVVDKIETDVFTVGNLDDRFDTDDPVAYMLETVDQCDACIVLRRDGEKEAVLDDFVESYTGDTPVYVYPFNE